MVEAHEAIARRSTKAPDDVITAKRNTSLPCDELTTIYPETFQAVISAQKEETSLEGKSVGY